jgi:hypothetical protein
VLWDWRTCLCLFIVSNRPRSASIDVVFQGRAAFHAPSKVHDRPGAPVSLSLARLRKAGAYARGRGSRILEYLPTHSRHCRHHFLPSCDLSRRWNTLVLGRRVSPSSLTVPSRLCLAPLAEYVHGNISGFRYSRQAHAASLQTMLELQSSRICQQCCR